MTKFTSMEVTLRPLVLQDADRVVALLNNKIIWDNLRDYIPFPYHKEDAIAFINNVFEEDPKSTFGILFKDQLCGVIGLKLQSDVYRLSAEVGYWIGENYWGKGVATKALELITNFGFEKLNLERIFAGTFDHNTGSRKVLERCGYQFEGVARSAVIKNNQILDEHKYAILKSDWSKIS